MTDGSSHPRLERHGQRAALTERGNRDSGVAITCAASRARSGQLVKHGVERSEPQGFALLLRAPRLECFATAICELGQNDTFQPSMQQCSILPYSLIDRWR